MKNKKIFLGIIINIAIGAMLFGTGIFFSIAETVSHERLLPETMFNRTQLSEKPLSKAKEQIMETENKKLDSLAVSVEYKGKPYVFKASESGVGTNVQKVLGECFDVYSSSQNAFEKLQALYDIRDKAALATVSLTINEAVLKQKVHDYVKSVSMEPQDSKAVFNPETRAFTYSESKNGITLDEEDLFKQLKGAFTKMQNATIEATEKTVVPTVKMEDAKKATQLIGFYETDLNSNEDRNTNIQLMCDAFDGQVLMPDETLSANKLVGERTEDKGFKAAPAIASGFKVIEELGGGICQATGTLYNAVLNAGLEIVDRNRHSWPSDYLPIGQDAMIDWPKKDFAFRNNSKWPVYISAHIENKKVIMEVFGAPQEDGSEIKIKTEILKVTNPKSKRYIKDTGLKKGQKVVEVAERIGYYTKTTRNYYTGDTLVHSELISEDNYPAVQGVVRIGSGSGNK